MAVEEFSQGGMDSQTFSVQLFHMSRGPKFDSYTLSLCAGDGRATDMIAFMPTVAGRS